MATPGKAPQAHSPSVSRLDEAIAALTPLDQRQLKQTIWDRIRSPSSKSCLPGLGRDEGAVDIFVDIANYSQDEELSERVKDAAGSVLSELSAAHPLPDLNALAELCYLCGQIGSRNSLDGLARLVRQEDAAKTIESSFEPLRLRALRCLVGLLADFQDDIEPTPYRSVLEACLQFEHCEKMALVGLTGLWPTDAEQAQYMLRIDEERRPLPNDLRLGLELAGFNRALSSPISFLKDDIQDSEDATGT